ncbi:MAG TPA: metallophosphoesterase family protein [Verrucomicrobiae bacterium]
MRTLAIGDIHGCDTALRNLLQQVQPQADDVLVFMGDYVDRGPGTRQVIDTLLALKTVCQPVFLRGNHEVMMLEARYDRLKNDLWRGYGGWEALASYAAETAENWVALVPTTHWQFMTTAQRFHETDQAIFVHGCLDPRVPLAQQTDWTLYWERFDRLAPHPSGKIVVCGHTHQASGRINDQGHAICIDTAAAYGGWLTCLEIGTRAWWQTNEQGGLRTGQL